MTTNFLKVTIILVIFCNISYAQIFYDEVIEMPEKSREQLTYPALDWILTYEQKEKDRGFTYKVLDENFYQSQIITFKGDKSTLIQSHNDIVYYTGFEFKITYLLKIITKDGRYKILIKDVRWSKNAEALFGGDKWIKGARNFAFDETSGNNSWDKQIPLIKEEFENYIDQILIPSLKSYMLENSENTDNW